MTSMLSPFRSPLSPPSSPDEKYGEASLPPPRECEEGDPFFSPGGLGADQLPSPPPPALPAAQVLPPREDEEDVDVEGTKSE